MQLRYDQKLGFSLPAMAGGLPTALYTLLRHLKPNSVATKLYLVAIMVLAAVSLMALASVHFSQLTKEAADRVHQKGFIGLVTATDLDVALQRHRRIVESAPAEVDKTTIAADRESMNALADRLLKLAASIEQEESHAAINAMGLRILLPELFKLGKQVLYFAENFAQNQASDTASAYTTAADQLQNRIELYRKERIQIAYNEVARVSAEAQSFVRWIEVPMSLHW